MKTYLKKFFLSFFLIESLIASNFSMGVKAYKQKDFINAKKYFEKAYNYEKINNAGYFLGIIYLKGLGIKKDINKAEIFLKNSFINGNSRAKCYLGEIYIIKYNNINKAKILLKEGFKEGAFECMQVAKKYNINL